MAKQKADDLIDLGGLESQLAKAIAGAFKKGTDDAFSTKSFLKDLTTQMKDYTKEQEAQAFNDRVRALSLRTGLDQKEVELRLLAKRAKMENNSLINQLNINRAAKYAAYQEAQNLVSKLTADKAGKKQIKNAENLMYLLRSQTEAIIEHIDNLKKENTLIEEVTKERLEQLEAEREKAALQAKQDAYAEKIKEVKNALLGQLGITEKIIDQLRTPEMAKAIFAEQMASKIHKAYEAFEEFHKAGLSAGQAIEAQFKSFSIANLMGLADSKGVMMGMIEQYGNVNALSNKTVDSLGLMAHQFGISGEEALKLNATLSQMPGETSDTAANAMKHVGAMAKLQGIAPGKIMKDMSKNTEAVALFANKGAVAFGKSVIELHKMGVEISTAASLAKGLLDFESSINAQMEASVLLGKEINLDKAREMALNHDIEGATREILRNVGSQEEFNKLNVLQQETLAKAVGMTVPELQKAMDAQKESNKYSSQQSGIFADTLGQVMALSGGVVKLTKDYGMMALSLAQAVIQIKLMRTLQGQPPNKGGFLGKITGGLFGKKMTPPVPPIKPEIPVPGGGNDDLSKKVSFLEKLQKVDASKIMAVGVALLLVGAAIAVASLGLAKLVESFKGLENAGMALGAITVVMAGFVGMLAIMIPIITVLGKVATGVAGPLLALGAAFLMIGLGIGLATYGVSKLIDSISKLNTEQLASVPKILLSIVVPMTLLGISFMMMASGLAAMAASGALAMPVIGSLIALAAVATVLASMSDFSLPSLGGSDKKPAAPKESSDGGSFKKVEDALVNLTKAVSSIKGDVMLEGDKVGKAIWSYVETNSRLEKSNSNK